MVKAQIGQVEATIVARSGEPCATPRPRCARRQSLIANRIVTEAALDQATLRRRGAEGQHHRRAGIARTRRRTQLDYLTIRAPISGRTGSLTAKLGATVRSQDALPLVTINQTKPIQVGFSLPQGELGALRRALLSKSTAEVKVPGGSKPTVVQGMIAFVDNQVDRTTGTIGAKVHGRERRRGAVARPVGRGGPYRRGEAQDAVGAGGGRAAGAAGHDRLGDRRGQQGERRAR